MVKRLNEDYTKKRKVITFLFYYIFLIAVVKFGTNCFFLETTPSANTPWDASTLNASAIILSSALYIK